MRKIELNTYIHNSVKLISLIIVKSLCGEMFSYFFCSVFVYRCYNPLSNLNWIKMEYDRLQTCSLLVLNNHINVNTIIMIERDPLF